MHNEAFSQENEIKVVAFDLDGTLTQHRTPIEDENIKLLSALSERYKLIIVGAGNCRRIFEQVRRFPIDIIGNYGLQYAEYRKETGDIEMIEESRVGCDRESVLSRAEMFRKETGYTSYAGDSVDFQPSGSIAFPFLGTEAKIEDKLAFDPTKEKRRRHYARFCELFPEYTSFIGGSSSYDMVPAPNDKYYALCKYCARFPEISHKNILFVGDDYREGGNDHAVFASDIPFVVTDDYRKTKDILSFLL